MKKKRNYRLPILALILILVLGCLTGCTKGTEEQSSNSIDISIVDVSVTEPEEPAAEEPETEEPETEKDAQDTDAQVTDLPATEAEVQPTEAPEEETEQVAYYFRNAKLLGQHYEKHGIEMGFASEEEYEAAASAVINNPKALHKTEKEDGDGIYYVEETNEFVVLSKDGYIRTYFWPSAGIKYYNRQ